jgi:hypothetical protein
VERKEGEELKMPGGKEREEKQIYWKYLDNVLG